VISTGVGETLFFSQEMEGQSGTTVHKWEHFGFAVGEAILAGHVGRSDIGSVSQPLESTKACFK